MLFHGQLILLFLCASSILSLNIDDEFFSDQLLGLLEDEEWEEEAERAKRETIQKINDLEYEEESEEELHVRQPRHHYWTRKRGSNTSDYDDYYVSPYFPTFFNWNWFGLGRNKREVEKKETTSTTDENNEVNSNSKSGQRNNGSPFNIVFQKPKFENRPFPMKCCRIDDDDTPDSTPVSPASSTSDNTIPDVKKTCLREIRNRKRKFLKSRNFTDDQIEAESDDFSNFFSCEKLNRTRAEIICLTDCVGQKFNIVDGAGKFDVEKTKKYMLENFAVAEWEKAVSDEVVTKCLKEISRSNNLTTTVDSYGSKCNIQPTQFIFCVGQQYFLECPAEKLKNKRCVKLQEKLSRTKI